MTFIQKKDFQIYVFQFQHVFLTIFPNLKQIKVTDVGCGGGSKTPKVRGCIKALISSLT